jgi:hypothetical protein
LMSNGTGHPQRQQQQWAWHAWSLCTPGEPWQVMVATFECAGLRALFVYVVRGLWLRGSASYCVSLLCMAEVLRQQRDGPSAAAAVGMAHLEPLHTW